MMIHSFAVNNTLIHKLRERVDKLDCFCPFADLTANANVPFDEFIQQITEKVSLIFQNPESICVCVTIFEKTIKTANFKSCGWKLEADLILNRQSVGKLQVGYLGALLDEDSPFLEEEKKLLQLVASRMGTMVHRKILKDSLDQSEKRFRNLVENALVGVFQSNLRGELIFANNTWLCMLGYESLEEARSVNTLSRYRKPDEGKQLIEILKGTGKISNFEAEYVTKKGVSIFVLLSATLESDVITGMIMDITEHKLEHESLAKSEMRLAEAQRIAHLGSGDWDMAGRKLRCSEETYRIFDLLPQKFSPTCEAFYVRVHPEDRQAVREAVNQLLADPGKAYSIEHRVVRSDGSESVVHAQGVVILDKNRQPIRIMGTVQDITARKQAENKLRNALDTIKKLRDQLEAENIYLRGEIELKDGYGDIIGTSDPMKYALQRIRQVARTKTTVILTGETGTGKGIFARFLHQESDRRDKPFVNVNCVSLPANLIESELFGREKGAFTGSTARQMGRFELAHGGTIFLDEIGELPIELQAKLLRVIEDGEFERLGSPRPVRVDVRIIASTNRNLAEEILNGRFRKDLYYRLNTFPVTLPPLRQRREDILLLVNFFVDRFSNTIGKRFERISEKSMKALEDYAWPGNVRELINIIERAVILSNGPELHLAEQLTVSAVDFAQENVPKDREARPPKNLADVERDYILQTLQGTGWKIEGQRGAAQFLGINPSTLRSRMRKLHIKKPCTS